MNLTNTPAPAFGLEPAYGVLVSGHGVLVIVEP